MRQLVLEMRSFVKMARRLETERMEAASFGESGALRHVSVPTAIAPSSALFDWLSRSQLLGEPTGWGERCFSSKAAAGFI